MLRKLRILFLIFCFSFQVSAQEEQGSEKISLLFIGDIMGHDEQIWSAENRETHTYNYDDVFEYVKEEISEADITFANFEVTLGGTPYTGYPQFSSPAELAVACRNAGIDFLFTANNHSADRGRKGIIATINRLDSLGIPHTGTFTGPAGRDSLYPALVEKNGFSIALLNYTYGTNGITVSPPAIVNMIDKAVISRDIEKAMGRNPDAVIAFLHWGTEYDTIPSLIQTDLARFMLDQGVDLVIGSHPHVLQKMVWIRNSPDRKDGVVVYSLGNFVSNQRRPKTDGGTMVRIELEKRAGSTIVSNAGFYLTWVFTPIEEYRKKFFILPCSKFENNQEFFNKPSDYLKMKSFIGNSRKLLYNQNVNVHEFIYSANKWIFE